MTAHDPRVTLTEVLAGHVRLPMMHSQGCACGWHASLSHPDLHRAHLAERLEEHFAARLAPIRALAEQWADADHEPLTRDGLTVLTVTNRLGRDLRAALDAAVSASQDHDGAEGQGEGVEAGEGDLCAAECGKRVDRTIPNPIPEGFELMWSESMTGRALYCQACFDKPDPEES